MTVTVKGLPIELAQPFAEGVTVTVAVTGLEPVFVPINAGTLLPEPLAAKPTLVVLLTQLKVVPTTVPVNETAVVVVPLQTI